MVISIYGDNIQSWCMYNNTTYYFYTCNIQILYRISCVKKVQYNECVPAYWGFLIRLMGILVQWDCFRNHCESSSSWSFKTTLVHFVSGVKNYPRLRSALPLMALLGKKGELLSWCTMKHATLDNYVTLYFYIHAHTHMHTPTIEDS